MKILILGSGSAKSILTFRALTLGQQLAARGHQVSLMAPSADKYNQFRAEALSDLGGVHVIQPWQPSTTSPMINLIPYLLSSFFELLSRRDDLIYLYKPTPITILGLLPKLLRRTPVILDLDDQGSEVMRGEGRSSLAWRLVAICERLALKYATGVVVTSRYLADYVHNVAPAKPVQIVPNGVNAADYPLAEQTTPRPHIYYFGYINRLGIIEPLVRAVPAIVAAVPEALVTIIGGGSAVAEATTLAASLGVADAVTFTGYVDMYEAAKYTHFADIAVCYQPDLPTVRAASNMKVFQYMAMTSVPVVSNVGDLPLYTDNQTAGIVVPPDAPEQLATAIISLLQDPAKRANLSVRARELAETTYNWTTLAINVETFVQPFVKPEVAS